MFWALLRCAIVFESFSFEIKIYALLLLDLKSRIVRLANFVSKNLKSLNLFELLRLIGYLKISKD